MHHSTPPPPPPSVCHISYLEMPHLEMPNLTIPPGPVVNMTDVGAASGVI